MSLYRARGYRLLACNWRCRLGELDLVLSRQSLVVFCEVKARASHDPRTAFEAVTPSKQRRLRRLAQAFLAAHGMSPEQVRFDVVGVIPEGAGRAAVSVLEDAF